MSETKTTFDKGYSLADELAAVPARVAEGVKFLDSINPRWRDAIPHPEELNMQSPCKCVAGHLGGEYWSFLTSYMGLSPVTPLDTVRERNAVACGYGFCCPPLIYVAMESSKNSKGLHEEDETRYYELLKDEWMKVIHSAGQSVPITHDLPFNVNSPDLD